MRVRPPEHRDGHGDAEQRSPTARWRISDRRLGVVYAVLAAVAWSTAGILQRQLHVSAATQVAGRGAFAFVALAAYAACTQPRALASVTRRGALLAAGSMAVANSAFIVALNYASVAHVLILQSIAPLVAAGLGVVVLGERLTWRTVCAMLVALGGIIVMVGAPGGGPVFGDGLSLLTGVAFAFVIVVARRYRGVSMAPAMALAQLLVVIVFGPFAQFSHVSWADLGWLALLGCGQMGLGAIFFISAARFIPSSEMAMIFLLEVVLGPLWTWIALSETPNIATLVGGAVVILAVGAQVGGFGKREGPTATADPEQAPLSAASWERPPGAVLGPGGRSSGRRGSRRRRELRLIPWVADHSLTVPARHDRHRAPGAARCGGRRQDGSGTRTRCQRPRPRRRSTTTAVADRRR